MTTQEKYEAITREMDGMWNAFINRDGMSAELAGWEFGKHWTQAQQLVISLKNDLVLRQEAEANTIAAKGAMEAA